VDVLVPTPRTEEGYEPMNITPPTRTTRLSRLLRSASRLRDADDGAATAEYAVATMAAVGFAGLLVVILRSDEVRGILTDLIRAALTVAG
jgi:Protein of unknown function (DUF4244)